MNATKPAILVIDDEANILTVMKEFLETLGVYEVATAASAMDGLTRIMEQPFALVVADVNMPGMDGMELVMRIKASHPDMRVLMMSGQGDARNIVRAMKIGADDFITKPFNLLDVSQRIAGLIDRESTHETSVKIEKPIHAFGDYEIIKQIGSGGMGIVYRARQKSTGRTVALKILFPKLMREEIVRQRFLREARLIGELEHPNIVRGIDVGEVDKAYYLAMEFIEGKSMDDIVDAEGPFTLSRAVGVMRQLFEALRYIHERRVIHRDIKPTNILITPTGQVKVVDLGLTRHVDQPQTVTEVGVTVGTAGFMPPEAIFETEPLDIRSDIYSTGATIYYMLTGELPFEGGDARKIFDTQRTHVPSARDINVEVGPELDAFLRKMMAIKRADRHQTPEALIAAFEALIAAGGLITKVHVK
jgi:serine/threonine protein kinase/CheY-like chemotaxis protein